jgi:DNA-binding NarL/FixJ family response regulator
MEACAERFERSGAAIRRGWGLGPEPGSVPDPSAVIYAGHVTTAQDVEAALLAALRGAGIVAVLPHDPDLCASFFEDLRHLGPVEITDERLQTPLARLNPEQRLLLDLLAGGLSVTAAARRAHLSRRTADRRLATARAVLGVRTNAEAVVLVHGAVRHGS